MLWRQGDIFIATAPAIPPGAVRLLHTVLAEGEATGHRHRISDNGSAALFEYRGQTFLNVLADRAKVIHEEHGTIVLDRGAYRVWRQREYSPPPRLDDRPGHVWHRFVMD